MPRAAHRDDNDDNEDDIDRAALILRAANWDEEMTLLYYLNLLIRM